MCVCVFPGTACGAQDSLDEWSANLKASTYTEQH
jgi:hypothetical protein